MKLGGSRIIATGSAVPEKKIFNEYFESYLDTTDEWIQKRTGIKSRYITDTEKLENNPAAELGTKAAKEALKKASMTPDDVDCIICATFTPDSLFPATACIIAGMLECGNIPAFDLSAACSGFVYSLTVADSLIKTSMYKNVLIVGTEITSRCLDWNDRSTSILFGDGAGAAVLRENREDDRGILESAIYTDHRLSDILIQPCWGGRKMSMKGNEVFKYAVNYMSRTSQEVLDRCSLSIDDLDLLIPHQANDRIIQAVAKKLRLRPDQVISNVSEYGNTSAASIPIAMNEAFEKGLINKGSLVVLTSLGGGITYGSTALRI